MRMLAVAAVVLTIALVATEAETRYIEYDNGPIMRDSGGTLYITGSKGRHVVVPMGLCDWCKRGVVVLITFEGWAKATLKPYHKNVPGKPVEALVIKHGRTYR